MFRERIIHFASRPHLPRRSIRLRLTAIYGGLFLVSGAGLLAITYVLVRNATGGGSCRTGAKGAVVCDINRSYGAGYSGVVSVSGVPNAKRITPGQVHQLALLVRVENANDLHELLFYSGLALAIMAVFSVMLGWLIAGRVLRPLRTITAAARTISATNLHRRIALDGPDDELKELGDTFDELLARLEAFIASQRQFVANASHELRTPLALQRTLIQVALADPVRNADSLRTAHERVLASGLQQERLLEALLTLARGQTGIDRRAPFDLATVVGQVVLARQHDARERGLEMKTVCDSAPMSGDPGLVERLVANLVDNALRHNVDDGTVDIAADTRGSSAVLTVANTGPIVQQEEVDRLIQPFQRSGSARTSHGEGSGLGLSIVQAIVDAHGAGLTIQAPTEGGLVIEVVFPRSDSDAAVAVTEVPREPIVRALIVDPAAGADEHVNLYSSSVLLDGRHSSTPSHR